MSSEPRWVLAPNPSPMTLDGTRTYLVGRRRTAVIDPGPAIRDHVENLLAALDGSAVEAILVTHSHSDHSGAAGWLARETGAPIWSAGPADGSAPSTGPRHLAREGDTVATDEGELTVVMTPGHSPDHFSVLWMGRDARGPGAVFVGDLFMGQGDTTLVAHPEGNLADYLASLDRIESLAPRRLYPAHGPVIEEPAEAIARYRRHRYQRIMQVRQALNDEPLASPDRLVNVVYGETLDPSLRSAAKGSLEAVVQYLREQG